jgi:hypothetical protein
MKTFLLIGIVVCVSVASMLGQTDSKLGVVLRSDQETYSIKSDIRLTITRENEGQHDLLIPRQLGWGVMRTNIRVFDAKGHEIQTDFLADELPPPPRPYDFILLEPGEFFGTKIRAGAKELVNAPGEYDLFLEYTSYLPEDYAREAMKMPAVPFWSRERGTITSNRIRIHIAE